jgi:hypothetical protein
MSFLNFFLYKIRAGCGENQWGWGSDGERE